MRKACLQEVFQLAQKHPELVFIGSDLGAGILDEFRREMPGRFFMEGISEANLIGMAAGMAFCGKIPYVNTIATFLTRRAYEQIAIDVCLHDARVRLIGNGGGLVYTPLGPTHEATEDIALMRALPGMCVVAVADADEMRRLMPLTADYPGPMYIRLAKGFDPIVTDAFRGFAIGKAIAYGEGGDALLVTTGITLGIARQAATLLAAEGVTASVLHMPTVKPFDSEAFLDRCASARAVLTIEEHSVIGGLGSAAAELFAEAGFAGKRLRRLGLPDRFPEDYGSQASLMAACGLTAQDVADSAKALAGGKP